MATVKTENFDQFLKQVKVEPLLEMPFSPDPKDSRHLNASINRHGIQFPTKKRKIEQLQQTKTSSPFEENVKSLKYEESQNAILLSKLLLPYHGYARMVQGFLGNENRIILNNKSSITPSDSFWQIQPNPDWTVVYSEIITRGHITRKDLNKICDTSKSKPFSDSFKNKLDDLAIIFMSNRLFTLFKFVQANYKKLDLPYHFYDILCNQITNAKLAEWTLALHPMFKENTFTNKTRFERQIIFYKIQAYKQSFKSITYLDHERVEWIG